MKTPSRRKRVIRDGSAPARRSTTVAPALEAERRGPFTPESPEVAALIAANSADRTARAEYARHLEAEEPARGLSLAILAEVYEGAARRVREKIEEFARAERKAGRP